MDVVIIAQQQVDKDWTDYTYQWLIIGLLVVGAIVIAYANFQNGRAFRLESSTSLRPLEAIDVLQTQMARDGWNLGYRDGTSVTMNIQNGASLGSTAALGCFSIWLALLYLVSFRGTVVVQVQATETAAGSLLTTNGSKSGRYLEYMAHHLRELPKE